MFSTTQIKEFFHLHLTYQRIHLHSQPTYECKRASPILVLIIWGSYISNGLLEHIQFSLGRILNIPLVRSVCSECRDHVPLWKSCLSADLPRMRKRSKGKQSEEALHLSEMRRPGKGGTLVTSSVIPCGRGNRPRGVSNKTPFQRRRIVPRRTRTRQLDDRV